MAYLNDCVPPQNQEKRVIQAPHGGSAWLFEDSNGLPPARPLRAVAPVRFTRAPVK